MRQLEWGSSEVDWCEANFMISSFIAEFYNTISNVLFLVFPPLLIYLFRQYSRQVDWGINVVWGLLIIIGLGSVYFHATLSLVGQLLDEIAILWVLMAALGMWFPKKYFPEMFQQNRGHFKWMMLFVTVLSSGLACIRPEVNAFVLMVFGVPAFVLLVMELKHCEDRRVVNLGIRSGIMGILALVCWLNDRLFCDMWSSLNFPYLHCGWHILIFIASYTACVLFAYFDAKKEVPEQMPVLRYWPKDTYDVFGIPYVQLKRFSKKSITHYT